MKYLAGDWSKGDGEFEDAYGYGYIELDKLVARLKLFLLSQEGSFPG